jgi:hypothetical protein
MQSDKELQSEHQELLPEARKFLLLFLGTEATQKERITTCSGNHGGM